MHTYNNDFSLVFIFKALIACDLAVAPIAGYDRWRLPTHQPSFQNIDSELAQETVYAPSKKAGHPNSVWAKLHFKLLLPALSLWQNLSTHPEINHKFISKYQFKKYFLFSEALYKHLYEYQQIKKSIDTLIKNNSTHSYYINNFVSLFKNHLTPAQYKSVLADLPEIKISKILDRLLKFLPSNPDHLCDEGRNFLSRANDNCLLGRILQSFYADYQAIDYSLLHIDPRAKEYFRGMLYTKLIHYIDELDSCPITLASYDQDEISISSILKFYSAWYLKPSVVEMLVPEFLGAAEKATEAISILANDLEKETQGRFQLLNIPVSTPFLTEFANDEDFLKRVGRLAMCIDNIGLKNEDNISQGYFIRSLCKKLFTPHTMKRIWGSVNGYIPSISRGEKQFQQDITLLVYASLLNPNYSPTTQDHYFVNKLLQENLSIEAIRNIISEHHQQLLTINNQKLTSNETAGIGFILKFFGIDYSTPIPIFLNEIAKGFKAFKYEKNTQQLSIHYKEADQTIKIIIPLPLHSPIRHLSYQIEDIFSGSLLYPAAFKLLFKHGKTIHLPTLGRISYDPLGTQGLAHGASVIGFGCSVFFAGLQTALISAAFLGADETGLNTICDTFNTLNTDYRERPHLVEFLKTQTWQAVHHEHIIHYDTWAHQYYPQKKTSKSMYYQRLAELGLAYPELYPTPTHKPPAARASFYNGENVEENDSDIVLPIQAA